MQCPNCHSTEISKNGFRGEKQNHRCRDCGRQFIEHPRPHRGYSDDVRELCLKMYLNGMGFRAIERSTDIHHTTVISGVQQAADTLEERKEGPVTPQVGEVDELQTFVGSKKTKCGFGAP